jgi:hypothetical protein
MKDDEDRTERIAKRLSALEAKVKKLEKRNSDLVLKNQIVSYLLTNPFRSPLRDFFASPEFWENIYDSGQADCSQRCIDELKAGYKACDENYEAGTDAWNTCRKEKLDRAETCHLNCSGAFPPAPIG